MSSFPQKTDTDRYNERQKRCPCTPPPLQNRPPAAACTPRHPRPSTMSDEVSQFLEQVEQLRGKQIEDDQMRAREREEFMAAKRERQARREGEFDTLIQYMYGTMPYTIAACGGWVGSCKRKQKPMFQNCIRKKKEERCVVGKATSRTSSPAAGFMVLCHACMALAGSWQLAENTVPLTQEPQSNRRMTTAAGHHYTTHLCKHARGISNNARIANCFIFTRPQNAHDPSRPKSPRQPTHPPRAPMPAVSTSPTRSSSTLPSATTPASSRPSQHA